MNPRPIAAQARTREGTVLDGKYRIERAIAAGAMGAVFEGRHVGLGRRVAIKFAEGQFASGADEAASRETIARFYREARIASTLESDYVVQVFDVGRDPQLGVYMVQEFLEGEDLEARLARDRRLNFATAVTLVSHVARGLSKAHARGIVHRDVKPANILLCSRDDGATVAKVLDFGVSKVVTETHRELLNGPVTEFDTPVGTPYYMAPEQAGSPSEVDARADVFALGAILFEMLAGFPVFDTNAVPNAGLLAHILMRRAPSLSTVAPWVPLPLAGFVDELLSHDREARPRHAGRVLERLGQLYPNLSLPVATVILPPGAPRPGDQAPSDGAGSDDTQRASALSMAQVDRVFLAASEAGKQWRVRHALADTAREDESDDLRGSLMPSAVSLAPARVHVPDDRSSGPVATLFTPFPTERASSTSALVDASQSIEIPVLRTAPRGRWLRSVLWATASISLALAAFVGGRATRGTAVAATLPVAASSLPAPAHTTPLLAPLPSESPPTAPAPVDAQHVDDGVHFERLPRAIPRVHPALNNRRPEHAPDHAPRHAPSQIEAPPAAPSGAFPPAPQREYPEDP